MLKRLAGVFVMCGVTAAALAEPRDEVISALQALRDASGYSWITTARQSTREYPDVKRPDDLPDPPPVIEVQGKSDANGYREVTLPPSKTTVEVPVTAFIKSLTDSLADTPAGWLTRGEMRDSPRRGDTVKIDKKSIRLNRFFAAATRATNIELPVDDLLGLLSDIETYEDVAGGIVGRLKPSSARMLQEGAAGADGGREVAGTVLFQIRNGALNAYAVKLVAEIPRPGREPILSITRWGTSFSAVGATTVVPPREAMKRFAELAEK